MKPSLLELQLLGLIASTLLAFGCETKSQERERRCLEAFRALEADTDELDRLGAALGDCKLSCNMEKSDEVCRAARILEERSEAAEKRASIKWAQEKCLQPYQALHADSSNERSEDRLLDLASACRVSCDVSQNKQSCAAAADLERRLDQW